jgi:CelD/BcsL family acetyltransferase involved in cellulose biosynthesis
MNMIQPSAATAEAGTPAAISIEIADSLDAAVADWRAFEPEADCTIFQTYDRLRRWQAHVGAANGTRPVIVAGRGADGRLAFIFPFAIERRHGVRTLGWLGGALSDYNAPLVKRGLAFPPGDFAALWRRILAGLRADKRFAFDIVDLSKMPAVIGGTANPFLDLGPMENPNRAYAATLGSDWPDFHAARRSSGTRKRERNHLKQLGALGPIVFRTMEGAEAIRETIDRLLEQKTASFRRMGVPDVFAAPGIRGFLHDWTADPASRATVHVTRLDIGEMMAAASIGLTFRGCYALVASSYHDGPMARLGPGRAHLHRLLQHAIENGFRVFDFTIGEEPYKRDWADQHVTLYDHMEGVTLLGTLAARALAGQRALKRHVKQNPALWRIAQRVRAVKTGLSSGSAKHAGRQVEPPAD